MSAVPRRGAREGRTGGVRAETTDKGVGGRRQSDRDCRRRIWRDAASFAELERRDGGGDGDSRRSRGELMLHGVTSHSATAQCDVIM